MTPETPADLLSLLRKQALSGDEKALNKLIKLAVTAAIALTYEDCDQRIRAILHPEEISEPFASMTEEEARNWAIRRDERNGRHTP